MYKGQQEKRRGRNGKNGIQGTREYGDGLNTNGRQKTETMDSGEGNREAEKGKSEADVKEMEKIGSHLCVNKFLFLLLILAEAHKSRVI